MQQYQITYNILLLIPGLFTYKKENLQGIDIIEATNQLEAQQKREKEIDEKQDSSSISIIPMIISIKQIS